MQEIKSFKYGDVVYVLNDPTQMYMVSHMLDDDFVRLKNVNVPIHVDLVKNINDKKDVADVTEIAESEKTIEEFITDSFETPLHYLGEKMTPFDVMESFFTKDELIGYHKGNVIKYLLRYKKKGGIEDLKKAKNSLEKLMEFEHEC